MLIKDLPTPSIILDLDAFENNIERFHSLAKDNGKEIWPMVKTHKSKEVMEIQRDKGATGVLCGTLDEAEAAAELGFENVMYAYPVSDKEAIDRVLELSKKTNFIIRLDSAYGAKLISDMAKAENINVNYTVIVDSGLHRFGIDKEEVVDFIKELSSYGNLTFKGISTHPGHVYGASEESQVQKYIDDEVETLKYVLKDLAEAGIEAEYVTTGSTPTYLKAVEDPDINIFHPGNYVFLDAIQMSLGVAEEEDCALRVLGSIVSNPREGDYIMDAGAKCLGLDKGAHGNSSIVGHGRIIGHSNAVVAGLSEEVGKIKDDSSNLKVGDRIEIIPNHSCSVANLTDYIYCHRNGNIEKIIEVDIRGNSKKFQI